MKKPKYEDPLTKGDTAQAKLYAEHLLNSFRSNNNSSDRNIEDKAKFRFTNT